MTVIFPFYFTTFASINIFYFNKEREERRTKRSREKRRKMSGWENEAYQEGDVLKFI